MFDERPDVLPYAAGKYNIRQPKTEGCWPVFFGCIGYWIIVFLITLTFKTGIRTQDCLVSWGVFTALLAIIVLGIGAVSGKWGYAKGMLIALLLTGGLCGLIYSTCGNPFRPLL